MPTSDGFPRVGDKAVELLKGRHGYGAGPKVTIEQITETLVVTSDGRRYQRDGLYPTGAGDGWRSPFELVPASDPRVLAAKGYQVLNDVSRRVGKLTSTTSFLPVEGYKAVLTEIIEVAMKARTELDGLTETVREEATR